MPAESISPLSSGSMADYQGWSILLDRVTEKILTAKDVKHILGISYRQLNDWEWRGMGREIFERPGCRKKEGWRKFSIADLIALGVVQEAKMYGISITKLRAVMSNIFFTEETLTAIFPFIVYGHDVFFYSNFEQSSSYYGVNSVIESVEISVEYLRGSAFVLIIPVNRIADNIFMKMERMNFRVVKQKDSRYNFFINGIPLALEDLPGMVVEQKKSLSRE
jgi:hypothetical protein